jgi:hypothetical protein
MIKPSPMNACEKSQIFPWIHPERSPEVFVLRGAGSLVHGHFAGAGCEIEWCARPLVVDDDDDDVGSYIPSSGYLT